MSEREIGAQEREAIERAMRVPRCEGICGGVGDWRYTQVAVLASRVCACRHDEEEDRRAGRSILRARKADERVSK